MDNSHYLDPYDVLGISRNSTKKEIKDAYRKQAMKYHPDRGGDADAFTLVASCYHLILKQHDETLRDEGDTIYYGTHPEVQDIIRFIRTKLGLTQVKLAKRLGITQAAVVFYEQGKTKPRRKTAAKLIKLGKHVGLQLTMEDFGF